MGSRRIALLLLVASMLPATACPAPRTGAQQEAALGPVLRAAIRDTGCDEHPDRFDEEVFFRLHDRQLAKFVRDPAQRVALLTHVYCHAQRVVRRYREERRFELRMPPELLLAVMDVESRFNRYAVSSAGAVGLMQVMPFWPRELGVENRLFGDIDFNIRLGAEILGYYLYLEKNNHFRALGRYNGSLGRREYPDLVMGRLQSRWRG
ncbi:MAG: lytic transglycosylase domain-containing protein [Gammaproteobacteria bacterium]